MSVTPIRLGLLLRTNQIVAPKGACGAIAPALEWASLVLTYFTTVHYRSKARSLSRQLKNGLLDTCYWTNASFARQLHAFKWVLSCYLYCFAEVIE